MSVLEHASRLPFVPLLDSVMLSHATRERIAGFEGNARELVDELMSTGLYADAIGVIARVLPPQFAVAWACECIRRLHVPGAPDHEVDRAGLALAEAWLQNPCEENCRSAQDFAEHSNFECAGAWIAAAAGWTGCSIAPPGYTPVVPGPHLTASAVAAALAFLTSQAPDELTERQAACVQSALERFGGEDVSR